ncbi:phage minor capsid protein [Streptomyces albidoflavus]|uniref:phage minor capsid protein n=1 Tax=Streptomyces albidoflavus TaxID=1886 RepID=UPI002F90C984|nr:phage minor capsid protein [Streptomyces albidoflavus]WTC46052.1 phage minor capsid protein [Streptomyces albidoflavus]WTD45910.1 phage minor capsid protein [Streptomyces albidoflavus]WTD86200.1 phage minor capsid protein [Streptomyces albidoflavus]
MPVSPDQVEYLAATTADLYADVERRLLELCARQLAIGQEAPGWAVAKLAAVAPLRRAADTLLDTLARGVDEEVRHVVAEAYDSGQHSALAELGVMGDDDRRTVAERTPQAQAVDRLAAETIETVTATHRGILRGVEDGYRQVVAEVTAAPLLGTDTRRQATQQAMTRFADRGVSSFRDRAGRRWALTSYAEMAVRTSVGRAAVEAHMTTLAAAGVDLVVVSSSPRECPLCRPWERQVLSIGGPSGARTVDVEHAVDDGRMVRVDVAGSLDEARAAGLQHPNCRHSVSSYTPGITRTEDAASDPAGYEAGQRQRAIERNIRKHKNRAAAATTPEGKRAAEAKVRQWQGAMRSHLAAHPGLRRLRHREQPGASNLPTTYTRPADDAMHAARVRASDDATLREMSDEQLALATRPGVLDERSLARIEAEADRRDVADLRAAVFPEGRLLADLSGTGDEVLAWAQQHATDDELLRIAEELDRRYSGPIPEYPLPMGDDVDDVLAASAALDDALAPGAPPAEWQQYADVADVALPTAARHLADEHPADEPVHKVTRREAREMYFEWATLQYQAAEDATNGYLLNRRGREQGVDPGSLFTGPARIAYAYASDELKAFWRKQERKTQQQFVAEVTGQNMSDIRAAQQALWDARNKHDG